MQIELYNNQLWLAKQPTDLRKAIDGLSAMITEGFKLHPQKGIFVFYNKKKDKIKCLSWHKNGFVLIYKRLEQGRFHFSFKKKEGRVCLSKQTFEWLIAGLDWQKMEQWRELDYEKFS